MDPAEEEIIRVALQLVSEDDPTPRRERNEDEAGGGRVCEKPKGSRTLGAGVSDSDESGIVT
jgi:hypothetical protein